MDESKPLMQLHGVENLKTMLDSLATNAQRRVVGGGLRKAGARLRTYMKRRVPRGESGLLAKSIGMWSKRSTKKGWVKVGLTSNFYYGVLDTGRQPYKTKKGQRAGTPKFRTIGLGIGETYQAHKQEIAQTIVNEMKINIAKEWGKSAGRAMRS